MTDASANIIRMAGVDEAVTLADLNGVVQQVHHEALPTQFKAPDAAAVLPVFAEQSGRPEVVAFIAEVDGLPVGYVLAEEMRRDENAFTPSHSALYVHHVAVRPPARERGVGTALMLAIDAEARQRGLTEVRPRLLGVQRPCEDILRFAGLRAIQRTSPAASMRASGDQ